MKKNDIETAIAGYGSFHEDQIVNYLIGNNKLVFEIVRKDFADSEELRNIQRKARLTFHGITSFKINNKQSSLHDLPKGSNIDFPIIDMETAFEAEQTICKIYCDGYINNLGIGELLIEVVSKKVELLWEECDDSKVPGTV